MKKAPATLQEDVEELVEKSTVAEATEKIWQRFEAALENLDAESLKLLQGHFNGDSISKLSRAFGISEAETQTWLTKSCQELVRNLRQQCQVRQ